MKNPFRILIPLFSFALSLSADTADTINLARSYLGSEAALDGVESVTYQGTLVTKAIDATGNPVLDEEGNPAQTTASIEIIFAEPYFQRIRITSSERTETTGLDDYEAWQRIENPANLSQWRMTLLDTAQVRRLRANTWENLSFFRGIDRVGGSAEDQGLVNEGGKQLRKIAFDHGYGIVFFRFFDPVSGRLVRSETDTGATIVESGENRVSGVRFPNQVVTVTTRADGSSQTVEVNFDSVVVNAPVSRESFRVPSITRQ